MPVLESIDVSVIFTRKPELFIKAWKSLHTGPVYCFRPHLPLLSQLDPDPRTSGGPSSRLGVFALLCHFSPLIQQCSSLLPSCHSAKSSTTRHHLLLEAFFRWAPAFSTFLKLFVRATKHAVSRGFVFKVVDRFVQKWKEHLFSHLMTPLLNILFPLGLCCLWESSMSVSLSSREVSFLHDSTGNFKGDVGVSEAISTICHMSSISNFPSLSLELGKF